MAEYNDILAGMGITNGLQNLNPMLRRAVVSNIEREHGVRPPGMPAQVRRYREWAAAQDPGTDTSVAAYLAAKEANPRIPSAEHARREALSGRLWGWRQPRRV